MVIQHSFIPDMVIQHSFIPDNDVEPTVKKASVPVAKLINGRWCWKAFDSDEYVHEPELEQILLTALSKQRMAA